MGVDRSKIMLKLPSLFFAFLSSVFAHGGVLWPPIWQAGVETPIEELTTYAAFSDPKVHDPKSGRVVTSVKSWLTDQAYTGGVGDEFKGIGPVTNNQTKLLKPSDRCGPMCVVNTNPWAAPGRAPQAQLVGNRSQLEEAIEEHRRSGLMRGWSAS